MITIICPQSLKTEVKAELYKAICKAYSTLYLNDYDLVLPDNWDIYNGTNDSALRFEDSLYFENSLYAVDGNDEYDDNEELDDRLLPDIIDLTDFGLEVDNISAEQVEVFGRYMDYLNCLEEGCNYLKQKFPQIGITGETRVNEKYPSCSGNWGHHILRFYTEVDGPFRATRGYEEGKYRI